MTCKVTPVTIPPKVLLLFVLWNDNKLSWRFDPDDDDHAEDLLRVHICRTVTD
jgi:hypothetical protein